MKYFDLIKRNIDIFLESIYEEIFIKIILLYFGIIEKTSSVNYDGIQTDCILLFWHEDVYTIILLRYFLKTNISVVVANSNKLNYWTRLLSRLKIGVIRSNNPFWLRKALIYKNYQIILALDGPFGPNKIPNKNLDDALLRLNIDSFFVNCYISNKFRLGKNWNKIILPIPFSKIKFTLTKYY